MLRYAGQHTSAYASIRQHLLAVYLALNEPSTSHMRQLVDADVCWRMLTYASLALNEPSTSRMLTSADVCGRMLTYAGTEGRDG
jgi:hypothetical protein